MTYINYRLATGGDTLFLSLCDWVEGITRQQYDDLRAILRRTKDIELPCLRRRGEQLERLTNLKPRLIDCCPNGCIAYTGQFEALDTCPAPCGEPRWYPKGSRRIPRQSFIFIPLTTRLLLQYRSRRRAFMLQSYCRPFFDQPLDRTPNEFTDWWGAKRYLELRRQGLFSEPTDIALQLMLDGVNLLNRSTHSTTPVLCVNYNLPPAIQYQKHNILLSLVIPGPGKYGNLDSFLHPLVEELKDLGIGVDAFDSYRKQAFRLRAWPVVVTGRKSILYCPLLMTFR